MNLVVCGECGVVLDKNILDHNKQDMNLDDGGIDTDHAIWVNREFVQTVDCPVCKGKVLMHD